MADKIVLIPISEDYFFDKIREIVRDEINKKQAGEFQNKMLSVEEARKLFNPAVSKQTLSKWSKEGLVPAHRIGGRIYYKHSELTEAAKKIRLYDHNRHFQK